MKTSSHGKPNAQDAMDKSPLKHSEARKIQPAPKTGKITRENIKRAVAAVSAAHKKK